MLWPTCGLVGYHRSRSDALRAASARAAAAEPVIATRTAAAPPRTTAAPSAAAPVQTTPDDDDDSSGDDVFAFGSGRPTPRSQPGRTLDALEASLDASPAPAPRDGRTAAEIADAWLADQARSVERDARRADARRTPHRPRVGPAAAPVAAPEEVARTFLASRLAAAATPRTPRTRKEAFVDLLVDPELHTYAAALRDEARVG